MGEQTLGTVEFVLPLIAYMQVLEAWPPCVSESTVTHTIPRNRRLVMGLRVPVSPAGGLGAAANVADRRGKEITQKLVPVEQVKEVNGVKPDVCRCHGHELAGKDAKLHCHQVIEIPPVVAEVIEYRLHILTRLECETEIRAELPAGFPEGHLALAPKQ